MLSELANGHVRVESESIIYDGVGIALMWHSNARAILEGDSGGPMASPHWGFCGLGSRLGSNEKDEITLSASERVERRLLGLIYVFSPSSIRCEVALSPSQAGLQTLFSWISELGSGGLRPRALLGSVGVG